MPTDLLSLSWTLQVALGSGYSAYIIAYRGIRLHHAARDTLFISLVFSLVASAGLYCLRGINPVLSGTIAFLLTLASGILWRLVGSRILATVLRALNITWSDDTPSAWVRLQENSEYPLSQISVLLKDGTWLHCNDTAKFNDAPYSPAVLGTNGDVLMYLTSVKKTGVEEKEQTTVLDPSYGARLTYIPSSEIARLNVRLMPSISRRPKAAALQTVSEEEPLVEC